MNSSFYMILLIFSGFIYSEEDDSPLYSYKGGWPVNPKSDVIEDPGIDMPCPGEIGCECRSNSNCNNQNCQAHPKGNFCVPKKGDILPRFEAIDQFGESVDLYDFSQQGKMILIEVCGIWANPCSDFSSWLTTNDQKITESRWWKDRYQPIRDMIENGEIFLINVMSQGADGTQSTPTPDEVANWYQKYPNPNVPILADEYKFIYDWVKPTAFPCIFLVDENMGLVNYTNRGLVDAFLYLTEPDK